MRKGTLVCSILSCFLIYALLRYPSAMLAASTESIRLWLTKVFPSLFPFAAACGILLRLGTAERLSRPFRSAMKILFRLDGIAAFPFFLGSLSGYPMGARITAQLYETKRITLAEAEHILQFSCNPGPLFLIGTIGAGFFGMPIYGYLLFSSCFLSAILSGVLWRFRRKTPAPYHPSVPLSRKVSLSDALSLSLSDALNTLLLIGAYLIFFGALSEAMKQTGLFNLLHFLPFSAKTIQAFCSGLLEMTNGAYLLSKSADALRLRLTFAAFLVSFGGFSILGQTFSVLSALPLRKKDYLKGKLLNALFSSLFCYFLFPFFEQKAQKAVPVFFSVTETAFTLSFLWLLPSLFLLGTVCHALRSKE